MSKTETIVHCALLDKDLPGFDSAPYPGALGQKIFESVSLQAWQLWLSHQTTLINEYRLNPLDPEARSMLEAEMDKFFFQGGSKKPSEFKEML